MEIIHLNLRNKLKAWLHTFIMITKEKKVCPVIIPTDKDKLLDGKVALITGGSSGIGLAIAEAFLKSGAKVIIAGTNKNKIDSVLKKLNGNAKGLVIDVKDISSLPDKVCEAAGLFEENRIDILVNSAGVGAKNGFWNVDEQEYDAIMDTNAKGTFFMSQAVGKHMIENNVRGHILNVSSSSALRPAWTPYIMSKWAVKGLTKGLADILISDGIVVNAIAPGPTATPMLNKQNSDNIYEPYSPSHRYCMPQEIASLAVYMVSGAGDMIVGDTFYVTGGSGTITLHH